VLKSKTRRMDAEQRALIGHLNMYWTAKTGRSLIDSNEGFTLLRQLTTFSNTLYRKRYTGIKYAQATLVRTGIGNQVGMRQFGWYSTDEKGEFKTLANSTDDLPKISADFKEHLVPIRLSGASIEWGWEDMEAAMLHNLPLSTELGLAVRRAAERYLDRISVAGDEEYGIKGLLSDQSEMTDFSTTFGASGYKNKTADQKNTAFKQLISQVPAATGYNFGANVVIMPGRYLEDLRTTDIEIENRTISIKKHLEETYEDQNLRLISWERLAGYTGEDISNKDVIMAYPLDEECSENRIIVPFLMKAPMVDVNHNTHVSAYVKLVGYIKRQPKSHVFAATTWD